MWNIGRIHRFFRKNLQSSWVRFLNPTSFGFRISILVNLEPKMAKKTNFKIQNLSPPMTKMLQKPFFRHFKPPKGYDWHPHMFLGKDNFFWAQLDQKNALKAPPTCRVK